MVYGQRVRSDTDSRQALTPSTVAVATRRYAFLLMTAKERLLERAPHWSEEQAERALRAAESGEAVDEWGDLSKLHEASSAETMRRLAKEEQAAEHEPW